MASPPLGMSLLPALTKTANSGILITGVKPDSLAERAGIQVGDELLHVGKHRVQTMQEFWQARQANPQKVALHLRRGEQFLTISLDVVVSVYPQLPQSPEAAKKNLEDADDPLLSVLAGLGLERYCDVLKEKGYDNIEDVKAMSQEELERIGVREGHARRIAKYFNPPQVEGVPVGVPVMQQQAAQSGAGERGGSWWQSEPAAGEMKEDVARPIAGLSDVPLLPLCESLVGVQVLDVQTQAATACAWADRFLEEHKATFAQSREELAAIRLFTTQSPHHPAESLHRVLNHLLLDRAGEPGAPSPSSSVKLVPFLRYLKLLLTGLYKQPALTASLWCGASSLSQQAHTRRPYHVGEHVVWWNFVRCKPNLNLLNADASAALNDGGAMLYGQRLFHIHATHAVQIADFTANTNATDDVFLLPGSHFQVVSVFNTGMTVVELRQLPSGLLDVGLEGYGESRTSTVSPKPSAPPLPPTPKSSSSSDVKGIQGKLEAAEEKKDAGMDALDPKLSRMVAACKPDGPGLQSLRYDFDLADWTALVNWAKKQDTESCTQYALGYCLFWGKGVACDDVKAVALLQSAADLKHVPALRSVGVAHLNGKGLAKDLPKAIQILHSAASQGDGYANYDLARCYRRGRGVAQNPQKALEHYRVAAEKGIAEAQFGLSELYEKDNATLPESVKLLKLAADKKVPRAITKLGRAYQAGSNGLPHDPQEATRLLQMGAALGDPTAAYVLGSNEKAKGCGPHINEAYRWFTVATERGHAEAMVELAQMHHWGRGVPVDYPTAFQLYAKAATRNSANGHYWLAYCYYHGHGTPRDREQARNQANQAAFQGHQHARALLQVLDQQGCCYS